MSEKKRRIMLCFSSPVDGRLMGDWVTGLGYEVVQSLDEPADIDLVFMDSAAARQRSDKAFRLKNEAKHFLPIVAAIGADEDVSRWIKAGFDDVIRLPATQTEWKARIEIMLRLRGQSEELGRKSESLHRALIESSGDQIFILDKTGTYVASNDRVAHFSLDSGAKLVGKSIEQVYPKEISAFYYEQFQRVLTEGKTIVFEHDLPSDQATRYHLDTLYPINLADGTVMVGGICRDITEQKLAEKKLARSEQNYRSVFENTSTAMIIVEEDGTIAFANGQCAATTGYTPEELQGNDWRCHVFADDRPMMETYFRLRFTEPQKAPQGYETRLIHADGTTRNCLLTADTIPATRQLVLSILDVTDRVRAEEARRVLETAINNALECIMVSDRENRLTYVNQSFEKLTGYSSAEALGNTPGMLKSDRHDRAFYQSLKTTIYSGHPWKGNVTLKRKNNDLYDVYATITPILDKDGIPAHFVSVHRDVTRERELENRIRQNQRLEAIGTLAGGIAHDFNNLLSPIIGYTELCMDSLPTGSEVKEDLEEVLQAALRATDLVRQILAFSRRSPHEKKPLLMVPIVKEALKLLRATIPATIEIRQEISATAEAVVADPTQIHQVVMNLCTNAFHAMPEGGTLTVTLKGVDLDRDAGAMIPNCKPGRYLKLSVEDTGQGIAPKIQDKIFEPYFTTKEEGRGTGLGLAVTHSIVAACGGAINLYSEPGKGTRFSLYFPTVADPPAKTVEKPANILRGHERILVIDDDTAILKLAKNTLERCGYKVTATANPVEALAIFQKTPVDFDMVITDMTMPGMAGDVLAAALLDLRPDLPVIVSTGFSERMSKEKAKKMGIQRLLSKPVPPNTLLSAIREIFDREK